MRSSDVTRRGIVAGLLASAGMASAQGFRPGRPPSYRGGFSFLSGAAVPAAFTMTQLAYANRVYQRSSLTGGGQGKGTGSVPHTINVTTPGTVYARRRSASDGATIVQAAWLAANPTSTGSQTVNITGVDAPAFSSPTTPVAANDGYFYIDLSGDGTTWTNGTTPILMGRQVLSAGQSSVTRCFIKQGDTTTLASLGITPSPYGRVFATCDGYQPAIGSVTWQVPSDSGTYTSAFAAALLNYQIAHSGVACGLPGVGANGSSITTWQTGQTNYVQLAAIISAAGGAFEAVYWHQGATDAVNGMSSATYQGYLAALFANLTSINTFSGYAKYLTAYQQVNYGTDVQASTIRNAQRTWAAANSATLVSIQQANTYNSGIELNQSGALIMAQQVDRATRPEFGLSYNGQGPTVSSVVRSAGNIVVTFAMQGGASLVQLGTANTRMKLLEAGTQNMLWAVPALTVGANTITFTDPFPQQAFDFWFDFHMADAPSVATATNLLFDNLITADETALGFTTGRCIEPTYVPVSVAALAAAPRNLTLSGAAYAAAPTGFGNALSAGYGSFTNFPFPPNHTTNARFSFASAPAANFAIFGDTTTGFAYINSSGFLLVSFNGAVIYTGTTNLAGAWHELEFGVSGLGSVAYLFLDGVLIATYTIPNNSAIVFGRSATTGQRAYGVGSAPAPAGVLVDDIAYFKTVQHTAAYTPRSAAYAGSETGMYSRYAFEGNGLDSCTN